MSYQKKNEGIGDLTGAVIGGNVGDFLDYDPVGLPDDKDKANIKTLIRNHEKAHPGEIALFVHEARQQRAEDMAELTGLRRTTRTSKPIRRALTLPTALLRTVEEAYPLMFRNRAHLAWFKKNFPEFVTTTRSM